MAILKKNNFRATSLDGFFAQHTISFMSDKQDLNEWSHGRTIEVEVHDYYLCMHPFKMEWRGKIYTLPDYQMFLGMIRQWMNDKWYPMTKLEAIELYFSIPIIEER